MSARYTFHLVDAFAASAAEGCTVAVVPDADGLSTEAMQTLACRLGQPVTAFVLSPRRDDCHRRARVFTPLRELPLSITAAFAAALVTGGLRERFAIEQGVIALEVLRDAEDRMAIAMPRPVFGQIAMPDPDAVARALGLGPESLDPAMPVLAGNAGLLSLLVPVRHRDDLADAAVSPRAWRQVIEKAKVLAALLYTQPAEGRIDAHIVGPLAGPAAWPCEPSMGLSLVSALVAHGRLDEGAPEARVVLRHGCVRGRDVAVEVVYTGRADRDGAVRVEGPVKTVGTGTVTL